ncbi:hypothetical protein MMC27_000158 [Xylographa pallens]|nr:hypothetical protein [Xylographa pallens]
MGFEFEIEEEHFAAYRANREGAGLDSEGVMHVDPERNLRSAQDRQRIERSANSATQSWHKTGNGPSGPRVVDMPSVVRSIPRSLAVAAADNKGHGIITERSNRDGMYGFVDRLAVKVKVKDGFMA